MYEWVDHTAELELRLEARTREALFADALAAFAELIGDERGGEPAALEVELEARDSGTLLAEWLQELVFLADTEDFVPERVAALDLGEHGLRATVEGRRGRPSQLVKAVTYHGLELRPAEDGWAARVVLDV